MLKKAPKAQLNSKIENVQFLKIDDAGGDSPQELITYTLLDSKNKPIADIKGGFMTHTDLIGLLANTKIVKTIGNKVHVEFNKPVTCRVEEVDSIVSGYIVGKTKRVVCE